MQGCAGVLDGTATDSDEDGICDNLQGTVADIDGNKHVLNNENINAIS